MKTLLLITLLSITLLSTITQAADEGIKVHGHWKFEIYNPDGSFDRKVEFENSLESSGAESLVSLLSRNEMIQLWMVVLKNSDGTVDDPCIGNPNQSIACTIQEVGQPANSPNYFSNLTVSNNTNKLTLQGSMTTASGLINPQISEVLTFISTCSLSNGVCVNPLQFREFTFKTLASPVLLTSGQIVQVTVEISFS